jgi:hypothetical protein
VAQGNTRGFTNAMGACLGSLHPPAAAWSHVTASNSKKKMEAWLHQPIAPGCWLLQQINKLPLVYY